MGWYSGEICIYCFQKLKGPVEAARLIGQKGNPCELCGTDTGELPGIYMRLWRPVEPTESEE
jgi:hypothetical protein